MCGVPVPFILISHSTERLYTCVQLNFPFLQFRDIDLVLFVSLILVHVNRTSPSRSFTIIQSFGGEGGCLNLRIGQAAIVNE